MAVPVIESITPSIEESNVSGRDIAMPATRPNTDVYLLFLSVTGITTVSAPGGTDWALIADRSHASSGCRTWLFGLETTDTIAASYTFSNVTAESSVGHVVRISGATLADIDWSIAENTDSNDAVAPSVTVGYDDTLVFRWGIRYVNNNNDLITATPSTTLAIEDTNGTSDDICHGLSYESGPASGNSTGTAAFTDAGGYSQWTAWTIAVKPASGSTPETITLSAATVNAAGQAVTVSAQEIINITAGGQTDAGQAVTVSEQTLIAVEDALAILSGQAVAVSAADITAITAANMLLMEQVIIVSAQEIIGLINASESYSTQLISVGEGTEIAIVSASIINIGEAVVIIASDAVAITASLITDSFGNVTVSAAEVTPMSAGALNYIEQSIGVVEADVLVITAGTLTDTGAIVTAVSPESISIETATLIELGQELGVAGQDVIELIAAIETYTHQDLVQTLSTTPSLFHQVLVDVLKNVVRGPTVH